MKLAFTLIINTWILLGLMAQPRMMEQTNLDVGESTTSYRSNECDRQSIIDDYNQYYVGTEVSNSELNWTGNEETCDPGNISSSALQKTLDRINYFRRLVGVPNGVVFVDEKNQKCREAALMMDAEGKLDHFPTAEWKCSTEGGIQAAGKSNLSYGRHSAGSVPQYIQDAGTYNTAVGHRRWILYPKAYEFGFGSTDWSTAMWVIGGTQNPEIYPDYVAYPAPGYFPKDLIYRRWSFSKKGAKYQSASVRMVDDKGNNIDLFLEEVTNGFGDNTLVWVPTTDLYNNENGSDQYFKVMIDSVKVGSEYYNYEYDVLGIETNEAEESYEVQNAMCGDYSGTISITSTRGYQSITWDNGAVGSSIGNLSPGTYTAIITDKLGCVSSMSIKVEDDNEPPVLESITGNTASTNGITETYSTEEFSEGTYTWTIENGEIIGETAGSEIEVRWNSEVQGSVCVLYTDNSGCQSNVVCEIVDLQPSSLEDIQILGIKISPNPAQDFIQVDGVTAAEVDHLEIFALDGRKVLQSQVNEEVDISGIDSGIYFVKINRTDSQKPIVQKLVIK